MRICAVVKYPPIEGGVSALSYRLVMALAAAGHQVSVVTNADEVEDEYRIWMRPQDRARLEATFPNGGAVTLVATSPLGRKFAEHIPQSKPFVSKLASLATEEIRRIGADVVYSYYLEPYGVAAHLAAQWTGTAHVVQHAGSDRTRLLAHPDLSMAYREVLRRADVVVARAGTIEGFGVDPVRVRDVRMRGLSNAFTDPDTPPLDVNGTIAELAARGHPWITNTEHVPADRATFGVYGKVSEYKGSYDLVAALARAKADGHQFNVLLMAGGLQRERFLTALRDAGLAERTWTLPFLPHWRVPEFLRAVTAVCFLERRFPIVIHTPGVPAEVLSVGTCLVVSREVFEKQRFRDDFRHGEHGYIVDEPSDTGELSAVLGRIAADPAGAQRMGQAAQALIAGSATDSDLATGYAELFQTAIARRRAPDQPAPVQTIADGSRLLRRFMPATMALVGTSVDAKLADLDGDEHPTLAHRTYAAANLIVDWVGQQNGSLPPAAQAAAAFERDLLWTRLDLESVDGSVLFPRRGTSALVLSDDVQLENRTPVAAAGIRIRRHRADIQSVLAGLRNGVPYRQVAAEEATFLFVKRGDLDGPVRRINLATERLLQLCDGRTRVSAIADQLGQEFGSSREGVVNTVVGLARERVILL